MAAQQSLEAQQGRLRSTLDLVVQQGHSGPALAQLVGALAQGIGLAPDQIPADVWAAIQAMSARAATPAPQLTAAAAAAAAAQQRAQAAVAGAAAAAAAAAVAPLAAAHAAEGPLKKHKAAAYPDPLPAASAAAAAAAQGGEAAMVELEEEEGQAAVNWLACLLGLFQGIWVCARLAACPRRGPRGGGCSPAPCAVAFPAQTARPPPKPMQGTDENEDGHTYAEYAAHQIRALNPRVMGHPGARRGAWGGRGCAGGAGRQGRGGAHACIPHQDCPPCRAVFPPVPPCSPPADPLVETASLASVPLPAPTFRHALDDCVAQRLLSDAQLETVVGGAGGRCAAGLS